MICPCHDTIDAAVAAHQHVVQTQARLILRPTEAGFDDAISDGNLALWEAIQAYNPDRGGFADFIRLRVRHRIIDGIRKRAGRGAAHRTHLELLPGHEPQANDADVADALAAYDDADEVMHLAAAIDPRLPGILTLIADGQEHADVARQFGISRTRIWQMRTALINNLSPRASA